MTLTMERMWEIKAKAASLRKPALLFFLKYLASDKGWSLVIIFELNGALSFHIVQVLNSQPCVSTFLAKACIIGIYA